MIGDPAIRLSGVEGRLRELEALITIIGTQASAVRELIDKAGDVHSAANKIVREGNKASVKLRYKVRCEIARLWLKDVELRAHFLDKASILQQLHREQNALDSLKDDLGWNWLQLRPSKRSIHNRIDMQRIARRVQDLKSRIHQAGGTDHSLVRASGLFDDQLYLRINSDVRLAKSDPLEHFMSGGAVEGRAASELFFSAHYLDLNPDVRAAAVNPLVHYLRFGLVEARAGGVALGRLPRILSLVEDDTLMWATNDDAEVESFNAD